MENNNRNRELIRLLRSSDMVAFDTIYNKYCRKLNNFVLKYIKDEKDAEEIVQDVFVKLWESRSKINMYSSFDSFLFTITYNTTISLLRKKVNESKYLDHLKSIQHITESDEIINELHYKELNKKVYALLEHIPPRQKEIFLLSREDGLTHQEIAEKLDISPNTVKNHLVKALGFLKSNINKGLLINILFFDLFL